MEEGYKQIYNIKYYSRMHLIMIIFDVDNAYNFLLTPQITSDKVLLFEKRKEHGLWRKFLS